MCSSKIPVIKHLATSGPSTMKLIAIKARTTFGSFQRIRILSKRNGKIRKTEINQRNYQ